MKVCALKGRFRNIARRRSERIMTKVSKGSKPDTNRTQILVRIPRNRLGELNKRWSANCKQWTATIRRSKVKRRARSPKIIQKTFVDSNRGGDRPNLPILVLKLDKSVPYSESRSSTSDTSCSSDSSEDERNETTHFKKKIIKKHSQTIEEKRLSTSSSSNEDSAPSEVQNANEEQETESDNDSSKEDDKHDDKENSTPLDSSQSNTVDTMNEGRANSVVFSDTMSSSSITPPSTPVTAFGKHVLPTAMIPQQQYSRLAMPLNSNRSPEVDELMTAKVKYALYPNVVPELETQNTAKFRRIHEKMQDELGSAVKRKRVSPIKRKSTIVDENRNENIISQQETLETATGLNYSSYNIRNGLELLSMACTATTAASMLGTDINSELYPTKAPVQEPQKQNTPKLHVADVNSRIKPKKTVESVPNKIRPGANGISPVRRSRPPPYNSTHLPATTTKPRMRLNTALQQSQVPEYPQIQIRELHKTTENNDESLIKEQLPRLGLDYPQPPNYNQPHNIISNPLLNNTRMPQQYPNTNRINHPDPPLPHSRDISLYPYLIQQLQQQHTTRGYPSTPERNLLNPPEFAHYSMDANRNLDYSTVYPLHPEFLEQMKGTKNASSFDTTINMNSLKAVDPNQTCTLYYESQNSKGQPECTKTVLYADTPVAQNSSNVLVENLKKSENLQKYSLGKHFGDHSDMLNLVDGLVPPKRMWHPCSPEELSPTQPRHVNGESNYLRDSDKRSENSSSPAVSNANNTPSPTPSVIIQNPSRVTPPTFTHRIENFLQSSTTNDLNKNNHDHLIRRSSDPSRDLIVCQISTRDIQHESIKNNELHIRSINQNFAHKCNYQIENHLKNSSGVIVESRINNVEPLNLSAVKTPTHEVYQKEQTGAICNGYAALKVTKNISPNHHSSDIPNLNNHSERRLSIEPRLNNFDQSERRLSAETRLDNLNNLAHSNRRLSAEPCADNTNNLNHSEQRLPAEIGSDNLNDSDRRLSADPRLDNLNDLDHSERRLTAESNSDNSNDLDENPATEIAKSNSNLTKDKCEEIENSTLNESSIKQAPVQNSSTVSNGSEINLLPEQPTNKSSPDLNQNDKLPDENIVANETFSDARMQWDYFQSRTKDLSHNLLIEMQFEENENIESIFAKIMPNCFMTLNLIQEMQSMYDVSWWPIDTVENLLKIKLSLRGITIFLKRSKQLVVHLNPSIHHYFLFLIEYFGVFRERVRLVLDTGYTLKDNHISMQEADIYRQVFIQLYEYLCCTKIQEYVNFIRNRQVSHAHEKDTNLSDDDLINTDDVRYSTMQQKHLLIVQQIKKRRATEEEQSDNFKKFISQLGEDNHNVRILRDDNPVNREESEHTSCGAEELPIADDPKLTKDASEKNAKTQDNNIRRRKRPNTNIRRNIDLIVIDSDSEEDLEVLNKEQNADNFHPAKKIKLDTSPITNHNIANIIRASENDDVNSRIADNTGPDCNDNMKINSTEDQPTSAVSIISKNIEVNEEITAQSDILNRAISNITQGDEIIQDSELCKDPSTSPNRSNTDEADAITVTVENIKEEMENENEAPPSINISNNLESINIGDENTDVVIKEHLNSQENQFDDDLDDNNSGSIPTITTIRTRNVSESENFETIEAIQNYLKETDSMLQAPQAVEGQKSDKACAENDSNLCKISSNNKPPFTPAISTNNDNRLIGIATPNVKDIDVNGRKQSSIGNLTENSPTIMMCDLQTPQNIDFVQQKKNAMEIYRNQAVRDKNLAGEETDDDRSSTQKLISFRKPLKIVRNNSAENSPDDISRLEASNISQQKEQGVPIDSLIKNSISNTNDDSNIANDVEITQYDSVIKTEKVSANVERPTTSQNDLNTNTKIPSPNDNHDPDPKTLHNNPKLIESSPVQQKEGKVSSRVYGGNLVLNKNHPNNVEQRSPVEQAKIAISEYFDAHKIVARQAAGPAYNSPIVKNSSTIEKAAPVVTTRTEESKNSKNPRSPTEESKNSDIHQFKTPHPPVNSKELLRQVVTKRHLSQSQTNPPASSAEPQKTKTRPPPSTSIPTLQSIYNDSINTNGFISQYIKDEIGILSKKESLGPVEYVEEITTLLRLPLIPKDFKDFYIFVTKQQILQFHQPIAFYIFLELLNQSGLKDYHKKFTEYTKRKFEDRINSKRREDARHQSRKHT